MNLSRRKDNTSGHVGVYYHKSARKWAAYIKVGGLVNYLGLFVEKDDAIRARQDAQKTLGFHTNHGL